MLPWLIQHGYLSLDRLPFNVTGDSTILLAARLAVASLAAFVFSLLAGPLAIGWLKSRYRERIVSDSARLNELHAAKNATPTMGGLFILLALLASTILFADLSNLYVLLAFLTALSFGALGAWDDWTKVAGQKNGLSARRKLQFQFAITLLLGTALYAHHRTIDEGTSLISPVGSLALVLGPFLIPWTMLVVTGSSNGVNLTDGLDGLAAGCLVFAGLAMSGLAYIAGHAILADYFSVPHIPGAGELAVVMGAFVGACLGFIWFNAHPAEVFMGDTGSLPLGALLGLTAIVIRQEVLLLVIGGVFVAETLCVVLQVAYFKRTKTRLFACSPLHNHYLFRGMHETKIVTRFWIVSALLAIFALTTLKIS